MLLAGISRLVIVASILVAAAAVIGNGKISKRERIHETDSLNS